MTLGNESDDPAILGRYLVGAGAIRFGIEFVRISAPVLGPLTLAQLWSCAVAIVGVTVILRSHRSAGGPGESTCSELGRERGAQLSFATVAAVLGMIA